MSDHVIGEVAPDSSFPPSFATDHRLSAVYSSNDFPVKVEVNKRSADLDSPDPKKVEVPSDSPLITQSPKRWCSIDSAGQPLRISTT